MVSVSSVLALGDAKKKWAAHFLTRVDMNRDISGRTKKTVIQKERKGKERRMK
jgi:hypothetical protein